MIRAALLLLVPTVALAWTPSTGTTWSIDLPWRLNQSGSQSIPNIGTVEGIFQDAYAEWEAPACTDFGDTYNGRSNRLSSNNGDNVTVHGFLSSWPNSYGDPYSVIGITLAIYSPGGSTNEADVSFNEAVYTFVQGQPNPFSYQADLESIAVHEFGHSLGLGHTNVRGATMFPTYDNGTGSRSIAQDDIDGVCALYPSGTGGGGGGTTDDTYEPNDIAAEAAPVRCGDVIAASAGDQDWFAFTLDAAGPISATLRWTVPTVDLDLYLFDGGTELDRSVAETGTSEDVGLANTGAGTYLLAVNPYNGQTDYTLEISCDGVDGNASDDVYEENDEATDAAEVGCPISISAQANDPDWFLFETERAGTIDVSLTWDNGSTDLDLYLVDTEGVVGQSENTAGTDESVVATSTSAGLYAVIVNPYVGSSGYTLDIACPNKTNPILDDGTDTGSSTDTGDELPVLLCTCNSGSSTGGWLALLALAGVIRRRRD